MIIKMILSNPFISDVRVYNEARFLHDQGHAVEILCWDKTPQNNFPEVDSRDGIQIRRFREASVAGTGLRQLRAFFRFVKDCKRYLNTTDYGVLHCHDLDGAVCGYLSRKNSKPFIFDMHEFYEKGNRIKRKCIRTVVNYLAKMSAAVIFVGKASLDTALPGNREKYFQLRNYPVKSHFPEISKTSSDKLRIAYIGTVRNQIPEFTALFEAVRDLEDVRVDIFGGGVDLEKLMELQTHYANVVVHGPFNGIDEMCKLYQNTDISFVAYNPDNPNYKGDFEPVKLYEAIITGTPIIATDALLPGKLAMENGFGLAVNTRDSREIREVVLKLMNRELRDSFSRNELRSVNDYNWETAVKNLERAYSLLN